MSTLHVLAADGSHAPYEESQIKSMLQQGLLSPETLYWKEGMPEWRPLREFSLSASLAPAPAITASQPARPNGYVFTKNPAVLTAFVKVMLLISLVVAATKLAADLGLMALIESGFLNHDNAVISDTIHRVIAIIYLIVFITTAAGFLKWIYRANLNCRGFGAVGLEFTPGGAIGCYFIPFLNLVYPYRAMREIWRASADPVDWKNQTGSPLIGFWWALWLTLNILGVISFSLSRHVHNVDSLKMVTLLDLAFDLIKITLCILVFFLIKTIDDKQHRLVSGALFQQP